MVRLKVCGNIKHKSIYCNINKYKAKNVVITGSTCGIGKSLAKQFVHNGDNVIITSRNQKNVYDTCSEIASLQYEGNCYPFIADVSSCDDCKQLVDYSQDIFKSVDIWINNAGTNGYKSTLLHNLFDEDCEEIINTNLLGTIYCCKHIIPIMEKQESGILINFEGAGSNGLPTPNYSVYGASKYAITQFTRTLRSEYSNTNINICTISPGMVITDLLIRNTDIKTKQIFNIFCEEPDYITKLLFKKIKKIDSSCNIHYLTIHRIIWLLVIYQFRKNRHFDSKGNLNKEK